MKSILIIGLGRFGRHIIRKLNEGNVEIMAVDRDESRVTAIADQVDNAQIGNAANQEFLESLGVPSFDSCIVAIGDDFLNSLETTSLLKELGAKHVIARAARDTQRKFLLRNGADEVVYPEKQLGEWVAIHVSHDNIFDYFEISKDYGVYEIGIPAKWVGKSLKELDVRKKYHLNIIATKKGQMIDMVDDVDRRLERDERVLVIGRNANVQAALKETTRGVLGF